MDIFAHYSVYHTTLWASLVAQIIKNPPAIQETHFLPVLAIASVMSDSEILWAVAHQAPLPKGFSRQENWSRLPCSSQGDLPNPGTEPISLTHISCIGIWILYH